MNNCTEITKVSQLLKPVNDSSPLPLYYQIFSQLESLIKSGQLPQGHKIPSENDLVKQLGVSRITVKRAINELAIAGLVTRRRGLGTTVSLNTDVPIESGLDNMLSAVSDIRKRTQGHMISRSILSEEDALAAKCTLNIAKPIEQIIYSLSLNGKPFSYNRNFIPKDVSLNLTDDDIETYALISLLKRSGHQIKKVDQTISATAANHLTSEILNIASGAPLLEIRAVMTDDNGDPLLEIISLFPPALYQYKMTMGA